MKTLTLAIVIPVYNEQNHLTACLEAISKQTVKPDEVIVVDNNSTDKSVEIAKSYSFVTVIKEKNQGRAHARTAGFNYAKSDLIGRIDADSILSPGWVHYVHKFYSDVGHADESLTGGCYFYNIRLPKFSGWWQGQIAFRVNRLLLGHYILFGSNMVMPQKVWREVRNQTCFDEDIHEDLDLAIHTHYAGFTITYRESLNVGIKMRRVRSNRYELWQNMMMWPNTLRKHHKWTWIFGWLGAVVLFAGFPVIVSAEYIARFFGRPPLPE